MCLHTIFQNRLALQLAKLNVPQGWNASSPKEEKQKNLNVTDEPHTIILGAFISTFKKIDFKI